MNAWRKLRWAVLLVVTLIALNGIVSVIATGAIGERPAVLSGMTGRVYYLQRDGLVLNLYTAAASGQNPRLLVTWEGKGESNANIIGYRYDPDAGMLYFTAMRDGDWSRFALADTGGEPEYLGAVDEKDLLGTGVYLQPEQGGRQAVNRQGSMFLIDGEHTTLLKRFVGLYDAKFSSGYQPIGFSPNGRYLLFWYSGHLTGLGTIVEGMVRQWAGNYTLGQVYVLDLVSGQTSRYLNGMSFQWVAAGQ